MFAGEPCLNCSYSPLLEKPHTFAAAAFNLGDYSWRWSADIKPPATAAAVSSADLAPSPRHLFLLECLTMGRERECHLTLALLASNVQSTVALAPNCMHRDRNGVAKIHQLSSPSGGE